MPSKAQIEAVLEVKRLCLALSVEDEDFPESSRKYIATLCLNSGWLEGDLIKNGVLTTDVNGDKIKKKRGRPRKEQ
jgi:hypothetical protein